ncbi:hypothetical protein HOY82DRAFT_536723 [Tuber indicum]|nr:hypothetical protein HOY82DRAFT_536723 [Tuber indicum]
MGRTRSSGIKFTGENAVDVKTFLGWMRTWFATLGDDYDGRSEASKRLRAAQIRMACPVESEAGSFVSQLPDEIQWDEDRLCDALMEQYHDLDLEGQAQEDILSVMNGIEQGDRDVLFYSCKVLKILRRKLSSLKQYDRILARYYIDGLASRRLQEMAILSFLKPDSHESPTQVVKGVIRLATQLRLKGYKKAAEECESNGEDSMVSDEDESETESDSDDDRVYKYVKKSARKSEKSGKRSGKKASEKSRKKSRGGENDRILHEFRELKDLVKDLVKVQKAPQLDVGGTVATRQERDVIPLDTYEVDRGYGQQARYSYAQPSQSNPVNRYPEFSNRRSLPRQLTNPGPPYPTERPTFTGGVQYERGPTTQPGPSFALRYPPGRENNQQVYQQSSPYLGNLPAVQPIIGPDGTFYYPTRGGPRCYNCGEVGHIRPHCPRLQPYDGGPRRSEPRYSDNSQPQSSTRPAPARPVMQSQESGKPVSVIEIAPLSSTLNGMKVQELTSVEKSGDDLMEFVHRLPARDSQGEDEDDSESDAAIPVMAGERARRFSELPPEFEGEAGPASQRQRQSNDHEEDEVVEVFPHGRKIKSTSKRPPLRRPIRMMAGREKFDFVGAFRDAPVIGLNWGSFFDLAPTVKKDICHLLVQERAKGLRQNKSKLKGKKVMVDAGTQEAPDEDVLVVATDRDLGDIANFYTKGVVQTQGGQFYVTKILVDAGSVVNLMPIRLLRSMGAKLKRAEGMVIRTATNALAKISYCTDVRVTIARVPCDLRIYALPDEYKPTYPMLLSRRWLQAVKAKGDYARGQYYIMSSDGTRVRIPSDESYKLRSGSSMKKQGPRVPIVLRDKGARRNELSAEVEEELELQQSTGNKFFDDMIELIKRQANEQMKEEQEEEEDAELSDSEN